MKVLPKNEDWPDDEEVMLDGAEIRAHVRFNALLDEGLSIPQAVVRLRKEYGPKCSERYYRWLSE